MSPPADAARLGLADGDRASVSTDKIVVGSLGRVGQRYILNAKMLKVQTCEAAASAYRVFGSLEELVDGTEAVALSLAED